MRIVLVLALALFVLPLSGCAKKKKDESTTTASNNQSGAAANSDEGMDHAETGDVAMDDPAVNEGDDGSGHGDAYEEPMIDDGTTTDAGDMGDMTEDMFADASSSQNRKAFTEGNGRNAGHGDSGGGGNAGHGDSGGGGNAGHGDSGGGGNAGHGDSGGGGNAGHGEGKKTNRAGLAPGGHDEAYDNPEVDTADPANDMPEDYTPPDEGMPEGDMPKGDMPQGDMPEGDAPVGNSPNGGRQSAKKPTDIPGVKEGTAEYAAVELLLKIGNRDSEGLETLIAEDADGLLKKLRSDPEKAFDEAKEAISLWKPQNSRLGDRETLVLFRNNKDKILQLHVRRIQGEYRVRELRVLEAVTRTPVRRRN